MISKHLSQVLIRKHQKPKNNNHSKTSPRNKIRKQRMNPNKHQICPCISNHNNKSKIATKLKNYNPKYPLYQKLNLLIQSKENKSQSSLILNKGPRLNPLQQCHNSTKTTLMLARTSILRLPTKKFKLMIKTLSRIQYQARLKKFSSKKVKTTRI